MQEPVLTSTIVRGDRRSQFLTLKEDALGVFVSPEDEVERVVLKVSVEMAPYIKTVPIHGSQKIMEEEQEELFIELHLIINHELESAILALGENVEVLEPASLRDKIRERVEKLLVNYAKINSIL